MKIPEWLPDAQRPVGPEQQPRRALIDPWMRPVVRFLHIEAAGGFVLLACTVLALILANSPWSAPFAEIWQTRVGFTVGRLELYKPLLLWINDGLMTIFFFVVGLEIKREIVLGELKDPRKAALPAVAALGGMVAPAAIYLLVQGGGPGGRGWGIPMATDIAFVVGFLALLGPRIPFGLKILLLTLAIVDDIGAILVIAVAYTANTSLSFLIVGIASFCVIYLFRQIGVRPVPVYVCLGAGIWLAFLKSGVHPTVAGVVLGLLTPASPWFAGRSLANVAEGVALRLRQDRDAGENDHEEAVHLLTVAARETISPLDRLEAALHPWVAFGIMPLFALANAGVRVELSAMTEPVALSVAAGLVLGKPLGIVAFSWVAVKLGLARLPSGVNWRILLGAGCLAGIGFTMSLFIAGLAFEAELLTAGKIGTLLGSVISATLGLALLLYFLRGSDDHQPTPSGVGVATAGPQPGRGKQAKSTTGKS
jgi:Na+:H+ antiporter, NhaA family